MQLVELQSVLPALREHGIALFAISYDPVTALAEFAARNAITYPLLADEGSQVIRSLGLLDADLEAHHAEFGGSVRDEQRGVCYPAVFILDEQGQVQQRRIQRNYRVRESGTSLLDQALGITAAQDRATVSQAIPGAGVQVALDSSTYWRFQRLHVVVTVTPEPGTHIFAAPTSGDLTPLQVEVSADQAIIGPVSAPEPVPFHLEGLDEQLWVYEDVTRIVVPLEFVMERGEPMGDREITVNVRFQACSESTCMPPAEVHSTLLARERPAVA